MSGLLDQFLTKQADVPVLSYSMQGKLYASSSGWILLSVPNSLVRGAFDALGESGLELPLDSSGRLDAHCSIMRPEEVTSIGGISKITERGHTYHYTLGSVKSVIPNSWEGVGRVWYITVLSPELKALRKSYGLSAQPNGSWDFHITIAIRKKHVLKENEISKAKEGTAMPVCVSRVLKDPNSYQLEGHDGSLSKAAESCVQELRRERHQSGQELVSFPEFSERYGGETPGSYPGKGGQQQGVLQGQLSVGNKKGPESEQEKQQTAYTQWQNTPFSTMVRGDWNKQSGDSGEIGCLRLECGEGSDNSSWSGSGNQKNYRDKWAEKINDRVEQDIWNLLPSILSKNAAGSVAIAGPGAAKGNGQAYTQPHLAAPKPLVVARLQQAYEANQKNDYATKTQIIRELMDESPDDWIVDDPVGRNWGITHTPTNFRFHMPPTSIPESIRGPAVKRAWEEVVKEAEDHELLKIAEDVPGIRDRSDYGDLMKLRTGQIYTLLSQMHEAQKAGPHHDLRIGDKNTGLFSWASRKGLPQPGQKHLAIEQPIHSWDYKDFEGNIESGYGAGKVKKEFERPIAITSIDQNKISFSTADGKHPERFNLVRTPKGWLMVNSTPLEPTPYQKLHYHKIPAGEVESILQNFEPGTSFQAKIDGASSLVNLMQHGVDLLSYRSSRQTGRPIIHTERVFGGTRPKLDIPPELVGSVLKGELYGTRDGKAIPASELGGILNAGIANSLDKQKNQNVKLQNALFDIQQYDGKPLDFHKVPYAERRKMLQEILQHLPQDVFHLSPEATTPEEARAMWKQIQEGSMPISSEGVVIHPPHGKPIKSKLTEDYDVWINSVFPGAGKYQDNAAGGFEYSLEPQGPPIGRVGTGFSDEIRKQMWENPNDWIGRVAKIRSQQQLPSGAYRAPAFLSLHEDITGEPAEKMAEVGKHRGTADSKYDPKQLTKGIEIEHEHTGDSATAKEVAKDHLSEFPTYYTALTEMEDRLKTKEANMPIYQRAFNAQLYRPIWNSEQGALYNLADNLKGWHAKGQQMVQEQANTEAFEDSMNPQQGWERFRNRLSGKEPLGPENPLDRMLFT